MRILTALAAGAIAAFAISAPATAATITTFTPEVVKTIVTEAGGTNITQETAEGISFTSFELGGIPFTYSIQGCDPKAGCVALVMVAAFETEVDYNLNTINGFNLKVPFATVVKIKANQIAFGRFLVSIGGITTDNIKANMGFHMLAPELFSRHAASEVVASIDATTAGKTMPVAVTAPVAPKAIRLAPKDMKVILDQDILSKIKLPK
jgi:hypothetical protein